MHFTQQPQVQVQHQGSPVQATTPSNTPYKYKIITDEDEEEAEENNGEEHPLERKLSVPSKTYLPPPAPGPSYHPLHPTPAPTYHHPSPSPSPSYLLPQAHGPVYRPPQPSPSPSYLPPTHHQPSPAPVHDSYLPPEPRVVVHNPTLANLNEVHTLPSLDKVKAANIGPQPRHHPVKPLPIFEPGPSKPFIGPQLPPKNAPYSASVPKPRHHEKQHIGLLKPYNI